MAVFVSGSVGNLAKNLIVVNLGSGDACVSNTDPTAAFTVKIAAAPVTIVSVTPDDSGPDVIIQIAVDVAYGQEVLVSFDGSLDLNTRFNEDGETESVDPITDLLITNNVSGAIMACDVTDSAANSSAESVHRIEFSWLSDVDGNAEGSYPVNGTLLRVEFIPGTPAPADGHNVTLKGAAGIDLLGGLGADLSGSVASHGFPSITEDEFLPVVAAERLTLAVTGAGDNKRGKLVVYTR